MKDGVYYRGLPAEVYDEWHTPDSFEDEGFWRRYIEDDGQPALEIGCGTGRLLLPYLRAGLAVEGIDVSPDMLAILRRKAAAQGLEPTVHETRMQDLDLDRRYRTIFVPFRTFMTVADRAEALRALTRFHAHLEPGGQLLVSLFVVSYPILVRQRGDWVLAARRERPDGSVLLVTESVTNDPVEQVIDIRNRYEVFEDGALARTALQEFRMRFYFRYEFEMMLSKAGFGRITACGDLTGEPVGSGHSEMIFRGVRP